MAQAFFCLDQAKLLQTHLLLSFTLHPRLARVTKPMNIERAYVRSLRPTVTDLWRQCILHPTPASPPTTRLDAYLRLYNVDVHRQTLLRLVYRPTIYLRLLPTLASIPLLRLRCQGSALPTLQFSPRPPAGTSSTNFATALTALPKPWVTNST